MASTWLRWDERPDSAERVESLPELTIHTSADERIAATLLGITSEISDNAGSTRLFEPAELHSMAVWDAVTAVLKPAPKAASLALTLAHVAGIDGAERKIPDYRQPRLGVSQATLADDLATPFVAELDESLGEAIRKARALYRRPERL